MRDRRMLAPPGLEKTHVNRPLRILDAAGTMRVEREVVVRASERQIHRLSFLAIGAAIAFVAGALLAAVMHLNLVDLRLTDNQDLWFEADSERVFANLTRASSDHYRTSVHPLSSLVLSTPSLVLIELGIPAHAAAVSIMLAGAGILSASVFTLLYLLHGHLISAAVFTALMLSSAAFLFFCRLVRSLCLGWCVSRPVTDTWVSGRQVSPCRARGLWRRVLEHYNYELDGGDSSLLRAGEMAAGSALHCAGSCGGCSIVRSADGLLSLGWTFFLHQGREEVHEIKLGPTSIRDAPRVLRWVRHSRSAEGEYWAAGQPICLGSKRKLVARLGWILGVRSLDIHSDSWDIRCIAFNQ
jgi:hypothetical protein